MHDSHRCPGDAGPQYDGATTAELDRLSITHGPDEAERAQAFAAVDNIPSIKRKAEFCFCWIDSVFELRRLDTAADRRAFLLNLICFAVALSVTLPLALVAGRISSAAPRRIATCSRKPGPRRTSRPS